MTHLVVVPDQATVDFFLGRLPQKMQSCVTRTPITEDVSNRIAHFALGDDRSVPTGGIALFANCFETSSMDQPFINKAIASAAMETRRARMDCELYTGYGNPF